MLQTLCIARRTSHKKSQSPHFRFPLFLFIASTVSHNAQEVPIYLGYLRLAGARTRRSAKETLSLSFGWFVSAFYTHTHTHTHTEPDTVE